MSSSPAVPEAEDAQRAHREIEAVWRMESIALAAECPAAAWATVEVREAAPCQVG